MAKKQKKQTKKKTKQQNVHAVVARHNELKAAISRSGLWLIVYSATSFAMLFAMPGAALYAAIPAILSLILAFVFGGMLKKKDFDNVGSLDIVCIVTSILEGLTVLFWLVVAVFGTMGFINAHPDAPGGVVSILLFSCLNIVVAIVTVVYLIKCTKVLRIAKNSKA